MNVEIINVGTELLLGEIVNTNATYIQKMCKDLGFNVYYQTTVGDNHDRFKECLDVAFKRGANCVITTGGLGPTQDDLTKELSAEYLGLELLYNGSSFLFWLPLVLLSIFLLVLPLLIKRELDRRPLEERQFTLKQIYAGMGLAHLAIILAGIYRLLTVRDAEWRLIIIVVIVLDICLLVFLTPRVLKIIKQSERG